MVKQDTQVFARWTVLIGAALALALPAAALADSGAGGKGGARVDKLADAVTKLERRFDAFQKRCGGEKPPAGCAKAAGRLEDRTERLKSRITDLVSRIRDRCEGPGSSATGASNPSAAGPTSGQAGKQAERERRCEGAADLIQRLEGLKDRLQRMDDWLNEHFPRASATAPTAAP